MYVQQCIQLTGTNGRLLDHSYRVLALSESIDCAIEGCSQWTTRLEGGVIRLHASSAKSNGCMPAKSIRFQALNWATVCSPRGVPITTTCHREGGEPRFSGEHI